MLMAANAIRGKTSLGQRSDGAKQRDRLQLRQNDVWLVKNPEIENFSG
jgi:hypothetical protein